MKNVIKKITYFFLFFFVFLISLTIFSKKIFYHKVYNTKASGLSEKYSMKERFGVGLALQVCPNSPRCLIGLDYFDKPGHSYSSLNLGWYFDWSDGMNNPNSGYRIKENIAFMGLVGGWKKKYNNNYCRRLTKYISENKSRYPAGMVWTIGNEVGWDDQLSPQDYAEEFVKYYNCLKSIDKNFIVATGAIQFFRLPADFDPVRNEPILVCVPPNYQEVINGKEYYSGQNYFRRFISELKKYKDINGESLKPEAVVMHGYTPCDPLTGKGGWRSIYWANSSILKAYIRQFRQLMREQQLADVDLIIKEWGVLPEDGFDIFFNKRLSEEQRMRARIDYLKEMIDFFVKEKNLLIGNPNDEYRLVQKWAYFVSSGFYSGADENKYYYLGLWSRDTKELTSLGISYKSLIETYLAEGNRNNSNLVTASPTPNSYISCGNQEFCYPVPTIIPKWERRCNKDYRNWGGLDLRGYYARKTNIFEGCSEGYICCQSAQK